MIIKCVLVTLFGPDKSFTVKTVILKIFFGVVFTAKMVMVSQRFLAFIVSYKKITCKNKK